PMSDEALREYCDKNYHQTLPIIAEKMQQEKVQRRDLKERLGPRHARSVSGSPEPRRGHSESPRESGLKRKTMFKRLENGVFHMLGEKEKRGHWKSKPKRQKSSVEDDLSQPWVCEETDPFTPRIRYFDFLKTRMPSHIKTYDGSEDPEDHLKIFQAAAKTERWAMPMWCHITTSSRKNASKTQLKFTTSSREMGNPRKNSCGEIARSRTEAKLQEGRLPEPTKAGAKAGQRQIEEMLKTGKLSHLIKELKQSNGKDQAKASKKGETSGKDKSLAILMEDGTKGPMIIEAKIGGHCVHRMANIVVGKDGRHGTLNFRIDEFHGGKVTLSLQWNYREARGKENPDSSIHSPRNAKIPSNRRNDHITEQHDYSTRMHNGFRARGAATRYTLTEEGRKDLCSLLRCNLDIFAWKPAYMTRVQRHIAEHRLNIREGCLPVRQKKRGQAPERNKTIYEEVEKLVDAGIMKEVHYHSWLSNPVMIKKHDDSWRMCVDFKDLNKACPKDGYPLLEMTGR
ncbi:hypothetical protein Tco_0929069, partial [Tanacetum coccineum]